MLPLASTAALARVEPRLQPFASAITSFLDLSSTVDAAQALAMGNAALLQRVLVHERAGAEEPLLFDRWLWTTLKNSILQRRSLDVIQVLAASVHASRSLSDAIPWAIEAHDLAAAQWLYHRATAVDSDAILREAIVHADLPIVTWLLDQHSSSTTTSSSNKKPTSLELSATPKGTTFTSEMTDTKWEIVELLVEKRGVVIHRSVPLLAARLGRLDTLRKIKQHTSAAFTVATANAAVANGHYNVAAFLGISPTTPAMDDAVLTGDLDIIQTIHARYALDATAVTALRAADQGHVHILQWLHATFPTASYWRDVAGLVKPAIIAATEAGKLNSLQWVYTNLYLPLKPTLEDPRIVGTDTVYLAVRDSLEVVQFLFDSGLVNWDEWESRNATYYASLDTLVWLHSNGLMRDPDNELQNAVYGGRIDCVQWILANRPRGTNPFALEAAAMNNRVDILTLLIESGFTGSFRAVDYAAARGSLEAIQLLHRHRRADGCSPAALHRASLAGHLDVVKFLTEQYNDEPAATTTTTAMDAAAGNNHVEIVRYLHAHRSEGCTTAAMDSAAANGHLEVVQFLYEHRSEGCTKAAVEGAAMNGHFDVVRFLVDKYPQLLMVGSNNGKLVQRVRAKRELEIATWLEERVLQPLTVASSSCGRDATVPPPSPVRVAI